MQSEIKTNAETEAPGLSSARGRRVYFVRHGITDWNKSFRYQGATDIPLCADGELQAERAAKRLSGLKCERIISSPLRRARRTAEIIAQELQLAETEVWDELTEVDFGEWEGLTTAGIRQKFGDELFDAWRAAQLDVTAPGGEDVRHVYDRSAAAAARLLDADEDNIIVVGHGAMFRALLLPLIGLPRCDTFWRMRMDNCAISSVDISKHRTAMVTFLNDTLHLKVPFGEIASLPLP